MYKINAGYPLKKGKVIRKIPPVQKILNGVFIGAYIVFFPTFGVITLGKATQNDSVTTVILPALGIITGVLIFYSVLHINRLRRIRDFTPNKKIELEGCCRKPRLAKILS